MCLERYPKVLPPPTAFEREYEAFAKRVQVEKSAISLEEYLALTRDLEDNKTTKGKGKDKGSDAMPIAYVDPLVSAPPSTARALREGFPTKQLRTYTPTLCASPAHNRLFSLFLPLVQLSPA